MCTGRAFFRVTDCSCRALIRGADTLSRSLRLVSQHVLGELDRLFDPDTAVTERAPLAVEERVARRVVQVHIEVVREDELHQAERVVGTWYLTKTDASNRSLIRPIDR